MTTNYEVQTGEDWFTLTITTPKSSWTSEPVKVPEGKDVDEVANEAAKKFVAIMEGAGNG